MELRQLRYFAAVAAHGSFNRAAKELHLTQPAVSRQVQNLEEELGTALLRRTHNTVTLTAAGEQFYEEACDLLGRADQAVRRVRAQTTDATLRISYVAALMAGVLPRAIQRFQAATPRVRLEFSESTSREICKRVRRGGLDMAILAQGLEGGLPQFQWMEVQRLSPVLVMPHNHPLAKLAAVHPAALREQPLHGMGKADFPEYAQRLRLILKPFGVKPLLATQSADGAASLFANLEASGGLAVLNDSILDMLPAALVGRPFAPALAQTVVVLGIPAAQPDVHAETFARLLREEAGRRPSARPPGRRRSRVGKAAQKT